MGTIAELNHVSKDYKIHKRKNSGLASAMHSLFFRKFETIEALKDVSFTIQSGDVHGMIGPNGAGKSTLIKIMSGILYPSDGTVEILGFTPWKERTEYVKNIGVLFGQKVQLSWELPPIDSFAFNRAIYKIPLNEFSSNLEYMVDLFKIEDIIQKPVRNLSFGERMKCEFVCALLHNPKLVFLDEPTIGLDVISKDHVRDFIKKVNKERGVTFIVTTHDMNEIDNLCNKVTVINHGKIVINETIDDLKSYFSDSKTIDVSFSRPLTDEETAPFDLDFISPTKARRTINGKSTNLQHLVSRMLKDLPVNDIGIENINIESIIRKIYLKEAVHPQTEPEKDKIRET